MLALILLLVITQIKSIQTVDDMSLQ